MIKDVFFGLQNEHDVLMESYVQFREIYIRMLSLESWGAACPRIARVSIYEMRELLSSLYMYLGNQALNTYRFEKNRRNVESCRDAEEKEEQAVIDYEHTHTEEGGAQ